MRWLLRLTAVAAAAFGILAGPRPAHAQGITTGSIRGHVVDNTGAPVAGAVLTLTNTRTGVRYRSVSRDDGRYNMENVAVGGPYVLEARLIGYQASRREGIVLTLGQRLDLDITMTRAAVELEAITVTGEEQDPVTSVSRTGTAAFISDTAVSRLPTLNRNFTDFVITAPQVVQLNSGAPSLAGGHNRMNDIVIDGVSDNDLFGLGATGQPGGQVDAKSISLEAIKEYQLLIAPFDVRQNNFDGGRINAVTRRGTNEWHGSAFWFWQSDRLVGTDTAGLRLGELTQNQRGLSLGGPLVQDRAHIFGALEWQQRAQPVGGQTIGEDPPAIVGIARDSAQRLVDIMRNVYGVDPGSFESVTLNNPNTNLFGRLDVQLATDHVLTVRHNHVEASDQIQSHGRTSYRLTSHQHIIKSVTNSTALQLNSTLGGGRFFNELRLGFMRIEDRRQPNPDTPLMPEIRVENLSDVGTGAAVFNAFRIGGERFSQANELDQTIFEITDDLTFSRGNHTFTLGTHNEFISFRNLFFPTSIGQWDFDSLEDLENGNASFFFRSLPFPGKGPPVADWSVAQLGGYVQDQFEPTPGLRLTLGLRVEVPIINDNPDLNPDLENSPIRRFDAPGSPVRTSDMPSGNIHWSPRVGFNYAPRPDRGTVVRGGAGIFTARPAYVWLSNAFTNTGRETADLRCTGADVPAFTPDPNNQPTECAGGGGAQAGTPQVNVFEEGFRFPQKLKLNLGIDQRLPQGLIGTFEILYTRAVNSIFQQELNIQGEPIRVNSEGRAMFGDPGFFGSPQRVDPNFVQVLDHKNRSEDWVLNLTAQIQKRFAGIFEVTGSYNYMKAKDLTSLSSSIATSNFGFRPVSEGGNPNDPPLSTSAFEVPHRFVLSGTVSLPRNVAVSAIFTSQSGTPYTWTAFGDANGDGFMAPNIFARANDIVYVPAGPGDFTGDSPTDFEQYNRVIDAEDCLREARGSIAERNTCRNPWRTRLDLKVQGSIPLIGGHRLTLVADAFNVLNFLNDEWGLVETVSFFETRTLLDVEGFDAANDRPIYSYSGPALQDLDGDGSISRTEVRDQLKSISDIVSRWRFQLGVRYDF